MRDSPIHEIWRNLHVRGREKSSDGVASKEAPKVEAPKVDAAKMPTWGSKAPEEITFTLDMFTKQCNPN